MPKDYSPFTPGRPVPADQFVGRAPEVERLRRMRELGVIQLDPEGGRGGYRFDNRIHHLYLCMEMQAAGRRGGARRAGTRAGRGGGRS